MEANTQTREATERRQAWRRCRRRCEFRRRGGCRCSGDGAIAAEDAWPKPEMPRNPLLSVPAFTRDMLPAVLADRVFDVATNMQVPPEFLAVPLVIDLGLVVGRQVRVRPNRGSWFVVPNLWGYIVSRSGTKKSPALQAAHEVIDRLQEAADRAYEEPRAQYDQMVVQRRMSLRALVRQSNAAGLDDTARANLQRQIAELSVEIDPPARRQYVTNDATIEAFGELLRVNQNGMAYHNDELVALFKTFADPNRGRDRSFYIRSWAGNEREVVNRIAAGRSIVIPALCVSICGGIQPDVLRQHLVEAEHFNDGLAARFQLATYPDQIMPVRGFRAQPDDVMARNRVRTLFARLDRGSYSGLRTDENPPYTVFAPDAQETFELWLEDMTFKAADPDREDVIKSALSKYGSLCASIALLFHLTEWADQRPTDNVGMIRMESLTLAIKWCDYLEQHLNRIYQSRLTATKSQTTARRIISKILDRQIESGFTVRDIVQRNWTGLTEKDVVRTGLMTLVEMDWLRDREAGSGARGGRPTTRWDINPRVFDQQWGEVGPIEGEEEERA
jgi:hypothetical protein